MSCLIDQLSPEIIYEILYQVRRLSAAATGGRASMIPSLQCCRRWYEIGKRALYGRIILRGHNLVEFVDRFSTRTAEHHNQTLALCTSMTISVVDEIPARAFSAFIDSNGETSYDLAEKPVQVDLEEVADKYLLKPLTRLRMILRRMTHLKTFSLSFNSDDVIPYWSAARIPGHLLPSLLGNLPRSCINLELRIDNHEHDGKTHSCPAIASLLPRLHHLRLSMGRMCPALFGSTPTPSSRVVYPFLRICIVNCNNGVGTAITCDASIRNKTRRLSRFCKRRGK